PSLTRGRSYGHTRGVSSQDSVRTLRPRRELRGLCSPARSAQAEVEADESIPLIGLVELLVRGAEAETPDVDDAARLPRRVRFVGDVVVMDEAVHLEELDRHEADPRGQPVAVIGLARGPGRVGLLL